MFHNGKGIKYTQMELHLPLIDVYFTSYAPLKLPFLLFFKGHIFLVGAEIFLHRDRI